jgi:hypothetical protein
MIPSSNNPGIEGIGTKRVNICSDKEEDERSVEKRGGS